MLHLHILFVFGQIIKGNENVWYDMETKKHEFFQWIAQKQILFWKYALSFRSYTQAFSIIVKRQGQTIGPRLQSSSRDSSNCQDFFSSTNHKAEHTEATSNVQGSFGELRSWSWSYLYRVLFANMRTDHKQRVHPDRNQDIFQDGKDGS